MLFNIISLFTQYIMNFNLKWTSLFIMFVKKLKTNLDNVFSEVQILFVETITDLYYDFVVAKINI